MRVGIVLEASAYQASAAVGASETAMAAAAGAVACWAYSSFAVLSGHRRPDRSGSIAAAL